VADVDAEHDREPDEHRLLRVDEPEEREREQQREHRSGEVELPAADTVRQPAIERDRDQAQQRGDDHAGQHRVLLELQRVLAVGQDEHGQHVEGAVLGDPHAHRGQQVAPVRLDDVDERLLGRVPLSLILLEGRRLEDLQPDHEADGRPGRSRPGTGCASPRP
jgi:hypothetical protein